MSNERPGAGIAEVVQQVLGQQGLMMTGFLGIATFLNEDGEQMYALTMHDDQTAIVTAGLSDVLGKMVDELIRANFNLSGQ